MQPLTVFEELSGQRLTVVQVHDAWGRGLPAGHPQARWPLAGAMALTFETHALFLTSPLRYLRSQQGTRFGLADGSCVDLGARALLCESAQAEALLWFRLGMAADSFSIGWVTALLPEVGQRLAAAIAFRLVLVYLFMKIDHQSLQRHGFSPAQLGITGPEKFWAYLGSRAKAFGHGKGYAVTWWVLLALDLLFLLSGE